jgi:cyclohexa-1,5-dienecarbonyl-CoA hydratase
MSGQNVELRIEDEVATLVLNRAPANLLNIAMMDELNQALLTVRATSSLKVLVLRGANNTFSDGMDLSEHTRERVQRQLSVFMRFFETIRMMHVVSIAAVEGRAMGAGFEIALGCNLFVATETATFALPQTKMGLLPPVASAILPRIAPRRRAMEWILTGNLISARRLEHDGVINRLFSEDNFDGMLEAFVSELTSKSGPVLQLAREAQFAAYYGSFPDALTTIQTLYLTKLIALEDAQEGPRAAQESRKPDWRNR